MEYKIRHNIEQSRFEAIYEDELIGLVDYTLFDNTLEIPHTEVSSQHEGKGIAGALNKAVLDYAEEKQYQVLPICSYTRMYIQRHPEYQNLTKK